MIYTISTKHFLNKKGYVTIFYRKKKQIFSNLLDIFRIEKCQCQNFGFVSFQIITQVRGISILKIQNKQTRRTFVNFRVPADLLKLINN